MALDRNDMSDDEALDSDSDYFARTYRPLSNLPTPPLSTRDEAAMESPPCMLEEGETLESALLGPAIHLVNMVPPSASLATPSVSLVQAILSRSKLPLDTIALAVCILDSLDSRFSRHWRLSCPPGTPQDQPDQQQQQQQQQQQHPLVDDDDDDDDDGGGSGVSSKQWHALPPPYCYSHIDAVGPEVIVVAALMIAAKFADDDAPSPTRFYARRWGRGAWSCRQLNATERCIVEALDYRIVPLAARPLLDDARADMSRAARYHARSQDRRTKQAQAQARLLPTPAESPVDVHLDPCGAAVAFQRPPPPEVPAS